MKKHHYFICLVILVFISCKKEKTTAEPTITEPTITNPGKGTKCRSKLYTDMLKIYRLKN